MQIAKILGLILITIFIVFQILISYQIHVLKGKRIKLWVLMSLIIIFFLTLLFVNVLMAGSQENTFMTHLTSLQSNLITGYLAMVLLWVLKDVLTYRRINISKNHKPFSFAIKGAVISKMMFVGVLMLFFELFNQ
ncbi:hypothetical protein HF295_03470 [Hujiaoplasma nucleasis]|uniref:Uncharacterized protein n=1 Tax=Hujiaoplasma nucleasis TaxID=2725268 RepID=A0A7L6N138_9MOLU|nr:hypothetical protein [Hujiaoplasma nucleasis]QLY39966.1 hypothetical protein HF295_03470 [Hujiaoplasma nucleasis]